ncbi:tyrosine-protein kinase Srms-like [Hyla sarda]|uniref:tyrosine-protein kinase Srms-like n=1 Tax=Hyla sarda TaxID=327740 RepID=UPI0024C28A24|nr:tyrosine-protein kinase Srms-like [Hyla sarda]
MEDFFKNYMPCMVFLWNKIWPPPVETLEPSVSTIDHVKPSVDIVQVLYDFEARDQQELSVQAGEELCVIKDEGDYIMARKLTGAMEMGLVPANYTSSLSFTPSQVTLDCNIQPNNYCLDDDDHGLRNEDWYVEVSNRLEAERLLMSPPNAHGSYLVRPSDTNHGLFSLSVRNEKKVTHFRININSKNEFYLQDGRSFSTIHQLIIFHKTNWKLLKSPLLHPCVVEVSETWERSRSEFKLIRKLGQGFFGEVYEGIWNDTERVAIKTFKQDDLNRSDFEKEINALKNLCHRNLIQLLAVCSIGEPVYIVTELMVKGNLNDYLKGTEGSRLTNAHFVNIICQVADGMEYLEKKHVVHRDLATRNVLVGENLICKIADFGLARILKDDCYSPENNRSIPIKWTAPEALMYCKYSTKSDVWSFGIVIFEIYMLGDIPYKGVNNRDVITKVTQGYRLPQPQGCPNEMYKLMLLCWMDKPQDRPSFQELVEKFTNIQRTIR